MQSDGLAVRDPYRGMIIAELDRSMIAELSLKPPPRRSRRARHPKLKFRRCGKSPTATMLSPRIRRAWQTTIGYFTRRYTGAPTTGTS